MYIYPTERLIKEGEGAFKRNYYLLEVFAGTEIAGSGTRQVNHCYRVAFMFDGSRHSTAYKTIEEAEARFNRLTMPIVERTA